MSYRNIMLPDRALSGLLAQSARSLEAIQSRVRHPGAHKTVTVASTGLTITNSGDWVYNTVATLPVERGRYLIIGLSTLRHRRASAFGDISDLAVGRILPVDDPVFTDNYTYRVYPQWNVDQHTPMEIWKTAAFDEPTTLTMQVVIEQFLPGGIGVATAIDTRLTAVPL